MKYCLNCGQENHTDGLYCENCGGTAVTSTIDQVNTFDEAVPEEAEEDVIVFDDDTALPLVQELRPDVIAKEGYSLDKWPEAEWLIKNGGQAITLKRIEGQSTTSQIERMKG